MFFVSILFAQVYTQERCYPQINPYLVGDPRLFFSTERTWRSYQVNMFDLLVPTGICAQVFLRARERVITWHGGPQACPCSPNFRVPKAPSPACPTAPAVSMTIKGLKPSTCASAALVCTAEHFARGGDFPQRLVSLVISFERQPLKCHWGTPIPLVPEHLLPVTNRLLGGLFGMLPFSVQQASPSEGAP